jgi:NAD(P)-dependent dehydrogenase (short-subunit alcohol dehydrogenase family)
MEENRSQMEETMPVALVTGASAGLGRALATALAHRQWTLILDARTEAPLVRVATELSRYTEVLALTGDVSIARHRTQLLAAIEQVGHLDLLVNNASTLGPSPMPALTRFDLADLSEIYHVNVIAPLGLIQASLPSLAESDGIIVNISSDAAIEHYEGWGGYGSAKAALDHLTGTLAAEHPTLHWYAVDPGDMRTAMHQKAFPGEDISDRPLPETVVPALLNLIDTRPPNGRYRAAEFAASQGLPS